MRNVPLTGLSLIASLGLSLLLADGPLKVVPPGGKVDGKTMAEQAAEWWKWSQSVPDDRDPVRDGSGEFCAVGQSGAVWFLAGSYDASHASRKCEVPSGKYVFFPVINKVFWKRQTSKLTCGDAKRQAALRNQDAVELFVDLDGAPLANVKGYRSASDECFDIYEKVTEGPGRRVGYPSATDGYWIMLEPPTPGEHHIKFGGRYTNGKQPAAIQDIEYTLTIVSDDNRDPKN